MFRSIRAQATVLAFVVAIVPLIVVGGIIAQRSFSTLEDEAVIAQQQEAEIATEQITAFLTERENQLQWLSEVRGLATLPLEEQTALLQSLLAFETTYREMALLNPEGEEVIRLSRREIFLPDDLGERSDAVEFQEALMGSLYVSDVQIDQSVREPFVTIGFPIQDARTNEPAYVLVADLRFRPVWDLIAEFDTDDDSDVYVTNTSGLLVAHADPSTVLTQTTYDLPEMDGRANGLSGGDVILAQRPFQFGNLELVVVSERSAGSALQLAEDNLRTSILIGIVALGVVAIIVIYFVGRLVRPIQQLSSVAQEITGGNLQAEAKVGGGNEISILAQSFNEMTGQLRGLIQNLEARVEERTAELQTAQKETQAALERAMEADQLKSQFLASMSHELRTPLNSILTFAELLEMETFGEVSDEQKDYLQKIVFSGKHLLALINDVLDITKIQSGMLKLFFEDDFNVQKEMDMISVTAKNLLEDKTVQVVMDVDAHIPPLRCDKRRVRQVLLNLVSNAVKFTEEGVITISAKQRDNDILFAVLDTGPGIEADQQDLIFEPFIQTETGVKHAGGTGLGLPISKKLVEAHGGNLWLESAVDEGSQFYATIPVTKKLPEAPAVQLQGA